MPHADRHTYRNKAPCKADVKITNRISDQTALKALTNRGKKFVKFYNEISFVAVTGTGMPYTESTFKLSFTTHTQTTCLHATVTVITDDDRYDMEELTFTVQNATPVGTSRTGWRRYSTQCFDVRICVDVEIDKGAFDIVPVSMTIEDALCTMDGLPANITSAFFDDFQTNGGFYTHIGEKGWVQATRTSTSAIF
jgi:hypothetical protein